MGFYIGISSGHLETLAVVIEESEITLCLPYPKSINLHAFNPLEAADRLRMIFSHLASRLDISHQQLRDRTHRLVLALPGAATEYDQSVAKICLSFNGWRDESKYIIADDTWTGLIAGLKNNIGISAVAGTGASVFVGLKPPPYPKGKPYKKDGWGPILGDYGSGFQLTVDFFRTLGRLQDKGAPPELFDAILATEPEIENIENVQGWFDQLYIRGNVDWRMKFAELASVITREASKVPIADSLAIKLVKNSGRDMATTIKSAVSSFLPLSTDLSIVLQGGMFEHSRIYRETVKENVLEKYNNLTIKKAAYRSIFGTAMIAIEPDTFLPDSSKMQRLERSITKLSQSEQDLIIPKFK